MKDHFTSTILGGIAITWLAAFTVLIETIPHSILITRDVAYIVWGMMFVGTFIIRAIEDLPHDH